MEPIKLHEEQETLLIPLYCKAQEFPAGNPILVDEKARQMLESVDYDFSALKVPTGTFVTTLMRTKRFDDYAQKFIDQHPDGLVLHLGCGLDARCQRLERRQSEWYDLDLPDVIELRKKFFQESDRYHMIAASVTDLGWVEVIPAQGRPTLALAEGLFMYLKEAEVKALLLKLQSAFPGCQLAFDAFSELTAQRVGRHPSLQKTGAVVHWGIDNARQIENWGQGIRLKEEWFFTQSEDIARLGLGYRLMFKMSGLFTVAQRAHRVLCYSL